MFGTPHFVEMTEFPPYLFTLTIPNFTPIGYNLIPM